MNSGQIDLMLHRRLTTRSVSGDRFLGEKLDEGSGINRRSTEDQRNRLKISYVVCESLIKLVNLEMVLSPVEDILYS